MGWGGDISLSSRAEPNIPLLLIIPNYSSTSVFRSVFRLDIQLPSGTKFYRTVKSLVAVISLIPSIHILIFKLAPFSISVQKPCPLFKHFKSLVEGCGGLQLRGGSGHWLEMPDYWCWLGSDSKRWLEALECWILYLLFKAAIPFSFNSLRSLTPEFSSLSQESWSERLTAFRAQYTFYSWLK